MKKKKKTEHGIAHDKNEKLSLYHYGGWRMWKAEKNTIFIVEPCELNIFFFKIPIRTFPPSSYCPAGCTQTQAILRPEGTVAEIWKRVAVLAFLQFTYYY